MFYLQTWSRLPFADPRPKKKTENETVDRTRHLYKKY